MKTEGVEKIIASKLGLWGDDPSLRTTEGMALRAELAEAADEIVELCESEIMLVKKEMALAMTEMSAYSSKEFAAYDVRLAVMGEALVVARRVLMMPYDDGTESGPALDQVNEALSAAPEVVWSGKGKLQHQKAGHDARGILWLNLGMRGEIILSKGKAGQQVTVYVVESQPQKGDGEE